MGAQLEEKTGEREKRALINTYHLFSAIQLTTRFDGGMRVTMAPVQVSGRAPPLAHVDSVEVISR